MLAKTISYHNFRNFTEATLALSPDINLLIGSNAAGKTSLLEGLYLFAQGRSHRTAKEADFIRFDAEFAELSLSFTGGEREQDATMRYVCQPRGATPRKFCSRGGVSLRRMSEFIGHFRAVLFFPEHLGIVKEGPAARRNFLDCALSQLDAVYVADLKRYNEILAKRNKILTLAAVKNESPDQTLHIYSEQLAPLSERLGNKRAEYTLRVEEVVKEILSDMSGSRESVSLLYKGAEEQTALLSQLKNNVEREVRAGATLFGCHKDEIEITLSGRSARTYASQGQQRSIALAMKLAEARLSEERSGERPVLLLDDVLSELDISRQDYILRGIAGTQTVITSAAPAALQGVGAVFRVEDGRVERE